LYLRALALFHKLTEANREAIRRLHQALEVNPSYAPAAGLAAYCKIAGMGFANGA
jgi:hypothetical protein